MHERNGDMPSTVFTLGQVGLPDVSIIQIFLSDFGFPVVESYSTNNIATTLGTEYNFVKYC